MTHSQQLKTFFSLHHLPYSEKEPIKITVKNKIYDKSDGTKIKGISIKIETDRLIIRSTNPDDVTLINEIRSNPDMAEKYNDGRPQTPDEIALRLDLNEEAKTAALQKWETWKRETMEKRVLGIFLDRWTNPNAANKLYGHGGYSVFLKDPATGKKARFTDGETLPNGKKQPVLIGLVNAGAAAIDKIKEIFKKKPQDGFPTADEVESEEWQEWGVYFDPAAWRKRYGSEALDALLARQRTRIEGTHTFSYTHATTRMDNVAGSHILNKLGFVRVGTENIPAPEGHVPPTFIRSYNVVKHHVDAAAKEQANAPRQRAVHLTMRHTY